MGKTMSDENNVASDASEDVNAVAQINHDQAADKAINPEDAKNGENTAQVVEADAESDTDGEAGAEQPKKRNRVTRDERISQEVQKRKEAERKLAAAEARLKTYEVQRPRREDFKSEEDFENARDEYVIKKARKGDIEDQVHSSREEVRQAQAEAWSEQAEDARERYSDFDAVINAVPGTVFNQAVTEAILSSERAADVAYALAKDPKRASRLPKMNALDLGREIGRLEAELAPKPRKISKAPPPVETVGSRGAAPVEDPGKMNMEQYMKWRSANK